MGWLLNCSSGVESPASDQLPIFRIVGHISVGFEISVSSASMFCKIFVREMIPGYHTLHHVSLLRGFSALLLFSVGVISIVRMAASTRFIKSFAATNFSFRKARCFGARKDEHVFDRLVRSATSSRFTKPFTHRSLAHARRNDWVTFEMMQRV